MRHLIAPQISFPFDRTLSVSEKCVNKSLRNKILTHGGDCLLEYDQQCDRYWSGKQDKRKMWVWLRNIKNDVQAWPLSRALAVFGESFHGLREASIR